MRLRGRSAQCAVCGDAPSIRSLRSADYYEQFCGAPAHDRPSAVPVPSSAESRSALGGGLAEGEASVAELAQARRDGRPHLLLDVRERVQFEIVSLRGSHNIPLAEL